jgi:hypothetical protein
MKLLNHILLAACLFAAATLTTFAQDSTKNTTRAERKAMKEADVKKLLESRRFVFQAQYANPLGGGVTMLNGRMFNISPDGTGHIYLNYNYDLRIRPDSVIAYLPYFGRAQFDAGYSSNPSDNGVMFKSTKFGYASKVNKKGITTIVITPQDAKYNRRLTLSVSPEGYANLGVIITNRSAISYDGYISEK